MICRQCGKSYSSTEGECVSSKCNPDACRARKARSEDIQLRIDSKIGNTIVEGPLTISDQSGTFTLGPGIYERSVSLYNNKYGEQYIQKIITKLPITAWKVGDVAIVKNGIGIKGTVGHIYIDTDVLILKVCPGGKYLVETWDGKVRTAPTDHLQTPGEYYFNNGYTSTGKGPDSIRVNEIRQGASWEKGNLDVFSKGGAVAGPFDMSVPPVIQEVVCTCGAKYTSRPSYHMPGVCDLIKE